MKSNLHTILLTALLMLFGQSLFAHDFEVDGIYYKYLSQEDKTVSVSYRGSSSDEYSNEYSGDVVIPSSVTYNGTTYSVTYIGGQAFCDCTSLTNIKIPSSVTSIGYGAFCGCTGLTSIEIPSSVTSIGNLVFWGCTGLTSIEIPNGVTSIGEWVFSYCTGLTSIEIPSSVTSILNNAFEGCEKLEYNEYDNALYLGNTDNPYVALIKPKSKEIATCDIHENCKVILYNAFSGCSSLESIALPFVGDKPHTATDTYQYPFGYIFGTDSYAGGTATKQYYYGSSTSSTTFATYYIPSSLNSVKITGSSYIPYGAFRGCTGLTSITIPSSVTSIGGYAFYGCTGLTSIEIPSSVTSIGDMAFNKCLGLTSIELPSSVTSIGYGAFSNCTGLTSIEIPSSVTSIGKYAFYSCSGLTSIEIPSSVTSIGDYAFQGCSGLTSVVIPSSVTSIGDYAFQGCRLLRSDERCDSKQRDEHRRLCVPRLHWPDEHHLFSILFTNVHFFYF